MSSSTSRFEATPPASGAARVWIWATVIVTLIVGCCISTVGYVDPFDSRLFTQRLEGERRAFFMPRNAALWTAFETERDKRTKMSTADVVILGDSRAEALTGGFAMSRDPTVRGSRVYNLAFSGASLYEQIDLFTHYEKHFDRLQALIVGTPYTRFHPRSQVADRMRSALRDATKPIYYLTDVARLGDSIPGLIGLSSRMSDYGEQPRPENLPTDAPLCTGGWTATLPDITLGEREYAEVQPSVVKEIFEGFIGPLLERQTARGVEIILFTPPEHPVLERTLQVRHASALRDFVSGLERYGRVFRAPRNFIDRAGWTDRRHLCALAAMQLLDMLLTSRDRQTAPGHADADRSSLRHSR